MRSENVSPSERRANVTQYDRRLERGEVDLDGDGQGDRQGDEPGHGDLHVGQRVALQERRERLRQLARTMSGGERQMLAIGRALMSHPQVLLLDEPSLGLSPLVCKELFQALGRIRDLGVGVLLVNLGTPDATDYWSMRRYLKEFLSDPRVIEENRIKWWLVLNLIILLACMAAFGATLTLPGIAGIALTIGMAVDTNVLIFERIREERRLGKTVRSAIEAGFARALRTIIDTHLTVMVTAGILYNFGTGPVKGFAVSLFVGLAASLFTAYFFTRLLFDLVYTRRRKVEALSI